MHLLVESLRGVCPPVPPYMSCGHEQPSAPSGMKVSNSSVSGVIPKSWRIPTPSGLTHGTSSSSSSSSSSDSDQREVAPKLPAPPIHARQPRGLLSCEICQTIGHHNASACPLAFVAAIDGDWEVARSAVQLLQKLCGFRASDPSTPWQMISGPGVQEVLLPPDGNCLFGSLALGKLLLESLPHQALIGHRGVPGSNWPQGSFADHGWGEVN